MITPRSPHSRFVRACILALLTVVIVAAPVRGAAAKGSDLGKVLTQKLLTDGVGALLNNQLPLKLDASAAFPTVPTLPGGPFNPQRLVVTAESVTAPLPPGDYTIRAVAFCSEYSIHRAGAGVAYQVGPIQGRAAQAIAALYWRGTVEKHLPPRSLLVVGWAIQSGVTYAKMTKRYQAVIDEVIPDYKNQLAGDFVQNLEDFYTTRAKAAGLPPLNTLLAKLGKPGELVITANRQRQILLKANTNDQIKDQVLFAGQEQRMAPVKPEEGPWSERIPGVAYVRYRVVGGNGRANNEIQIRILPAPTPPAPPSLAVADVKVVFASYTAGPARVAAAGKPKENSSGPSVRDLTGDGIGYSTSRAAQVLYFAPVPDPEPKVGEKVGKTNELEGDATLTRNGTTRPLQKGDEIQMGDTVSTGDKARTQLTFADGTVFMISENTTFRVDEYVYDPKSPANNHASYSWLSGSFRYVSGLLGKQKNPDVNIDTPYGGIGIRGTEFIGKLATETGSANIKLITGKLECSPRGISTSSAQSGPVTIDLSSTEVKSSPLTLADYNAAKPPVYIR